MFSARAVFLVRVRRARRSRQNGWPERTDWDAVLGVEGDCPSAGVRCYDPSRSLSNLSTVRWCTMGDKSPKAKDKNKKQDKADKDQKAAKAKVKANPPPAEGKKK